MLVAALELLALAVFAGGLIGAAASDVSRYLIPNSIPVLIAGAYGVFDALVESPAQWLGALLVALTVLLIGALLFARNVMGGGDVKLLAAATLWAGPTLVMPFLATTAFTGAALGLLLLSPARHLFPAPPGGPGLATAGLRARLRQTIPFGVAIAAGGLYVAYRRAVG